MSIETLLVGLTAAITSLVATIEESNNINRHVIAGINKKFEPEAAEPEVEEKPKVKATKKKAVDPEVVDEPEVEEGEIDEDEIDEDENVEVVEEKPKAKTKTATKKKVEVVEEDDEEDDDDDLGLDEDEDEDEASDITHADVRSIANKKIKGGVLRKVIKGIINDAGYDKLDDLDDEGLAVVYAKLEAL